jgi:DNA-binding transcriptional LysR family regulator
MPLALLTPAFQSRRLVDDAFRRHDLRPRIVVEHETPAVLIAAARSGMATAVVVSDALPLELDLPMAEVRDGGRAFGGMLSVVWRDDESLSPAARQLKDEMVAVARGLNAAGTRVATPTSRDGGRRPSPAARGRCRRT